MTTDSLYQKCKAAGLEIDNHCSDLYVRVTDQSKAIIKAHREENDGSPMCVSTFHSAIDGKPWFDIAFHFDPYWEAKP